MSGRKNLVITFGFVAAVSLISSAVTALLVSCHYSRLLLDLANVICGELPEQETNISDFSVTYPVLFATAGFLAGIFLFLVTFVFRNKMEVRRIQALSDYLEQVNIGKAAVLSSSGEDIFSRLEDEIYKTVTFLYQTKDAAVQAKNDFAENLSNIAHQIKTPITAISLSLQTLSEMEIQNEYEKGKLKQIQKQLARLTCLEEALLVLARLDAGTLMFQKEDVDVFTVLVLAADNLQELFVDSGTSIDIPESGEVVITADLDWTMEAIMNVMKNCMEHNRGGTIHCSYGQNPLYTEILIWDKNTGELQLKRRKKSPLLTCFFGMEGELAGNALKAQRRALRTASLSLIFSFLAFTIMQSFFTLSGISTRETYFERYQSVWDIMVTIKDTDVDSFRETEKIQGIPEIRSAIVYQRAVAERIVTEDEISEDMKSFGGFAAAGDHDVRETDGGWLVNAPVVILDDASFLAYCEQIGIPPQLDGTVIWNQIRDVTDPDFRHPRYMPYVKGENATSILRQSGNEEITAEIPVLSYTEIVPVLREEYATLDYYELVHFVPASLWKEIRGQIGGSEEDTCICILGRENVTSEELDALQRQVDSLLAGSYTAESENRIREAETNDKQIQGMMTVFGGFCILLAVIGIGNVLSNTLGFVRQRKREFARYMSVGMTPEEIRKMFCIEALTIAGRPILITLPLAAITVGYMLQTSYVEAGTFLAEAPFLPIAAFMLAIWGTVALAYYLGWRNIRKINLAEVLRDDTMM